eukprot:jgi/Mesvir1/18679/Mv17173-RA.3
MSGISHFLLSHSKIVLSFEVFRGSAVSWRMAEISQSFTGLALKRVLFPTKAAPASASVVEVGEGDVDVGIQTSKDIELEMNGTGQEESEPLELHADIDAVDTEEIVSPQWPPLVPDDDPDSQTSKDIELEMNGTGQEESEPLELHADIDAVDTEEIVSPQWPPLVPDDDPDSEESPSSPLSHLESPNLLVDTPVIAKLRTEVISAPLSSATSRTPRETRSPYGLSPHNLVGGVHQRMPADFPVPTPPPEHTPRTHLDFDAVLQELEANGDLAGSPWAASVPDPTDLPDMDVAEAMEIAGVHPKSGDCRGDGDGGGSDKEKEEDKDDDAALYRTGAVAMADISRVLAEGVIDEPPAPLVEVREQEDLIEAEGDPVEAEPVVEDGGPASPFMSPRASAPVKDVSGDVSSSAEDGAAVPAVDNEEASRNMHAHFKSEIAWPADNAMGGEQVAIDASIIDTELAMAEHVGQLPAMGEEGGPGARNMMDLGMEGSGMGQEGASRQPAIRRLSSIVFAGIGPEQLPQPGIPTVGSNALLSVADKIQSRAIHIGKMVAATKDAPYHKVVGPISQLESELHVARSMLEFSAAVAQESVVRQSGGISYHQVVAATARFNVWQDVYNSLVSCVNDRKRCAGITAAESRYIKFLIRGYHRRGMGLPAEQQQQIRELRTRIRQLGMLFQQYLRSATEQRTCLFSAEELEGLNERTKQALPVQADGIFEVPAQGDVYTPIMQECVRSTTRKTMEICYTGRAVMQNTEVLEELLRVRHEGAKLLGYDSHAHYVLQNSYLEKPRKVHDFLVQLEARLQPLARRELAELQERKRAREGNEDFSMADLAFYLRQYEDETLGTPVDNAAIMNYFPLRIVVQRALNLFQVSLGLRMQEEVQSNVWDSSVQLFSLWDARYSDRPVVVGHIYLDLYHREGKQPGAMSTFHLQPGCQAPFFVSFAHGKQPPVSTLVADFPQDDDKSPTLLTHSQVVQFVGKLGVMMQHVCCKVDHARFAGGMLESDMQEIAGLIYEKYCWLEEVLQHLSAHKDTGAPIPSKLLAPLLRRHELQQHHFVMSTMRQIMLARLDLELHMAPVENIRQLYTDLHRKILGMEPLLGTNVLASFEHIVSGYDSLYFSYVWKEVIATDLFASRFQSDPFSPEVGLDFRLKVLEKGGSMKASEMITSFLGRPPNLYAYLATKGL